ncbi:hypothetical protein MKX52_18305 [Bacillus sp. FSL R5-0422]|uniref:hypothetical protein n=1 Tax=Bacillus sp. FSL R5-0422 TaxID=2921577 RepID=UPI00315AEFE8
MTVSKTLNNILYILSLVFLVGSIIMYLLKEETLGWTTFFGTDALTLYGLVATFLSMLAMKINFIRKTFRWILLNLSLTKINYELSMVVDSNSSTKEIYDVILKSINESDVYRNNEFEVYNKKSMLIRFSVVAMNSTISIKEQEVTSEYQTDNTKYSSRHKIEIKSVENFKSMNKVINFTLNIMTDKLQQEDLNFNKFYLKVKKNSTEYNFLNINNLLLDKSFDIIYSETQIQKSNSNIAINAHEGITISARSRGEFVIAIDLLKDILVS